MSQTFNKVPVSKTNRGTFDLSSYQVSTLDFGRLQPIYTLECVANDVIRCAVKPFVRLAPMVAPTYGKLKMAYHAFFVPNRLLWKDFLEWNEGIKEGTPPYLVPSTFVAAISALDADRQKDARRVISAMGFPVYTKWVAPVEGASGQLSRISALPFRAYQRIWWDWYRDSTLISDSVKDSYVQDAGGVVSIDYARTLLSPRYRCFKKDFFTTLVANPQDGRPAAARVNLASSSISYSSYDPKDVERNNGLTEDGTINSGSSALSIQWLRAANALQRWLEKNNVVGGRLIDRLRARFGAAPTDVRLDMAEFIGSQECPIYIGDITSSNESALGEDVVTQGAFGVAKHGSAVAGVIQGQQGGKGVGLTDNVNYFTYRASEPGIFMVIASIMPDTSYVQGIPRMFTRGLDTPNSDRFDYFKPEMENLGMQPVQCYELWMPNDTAQLAQYLPKRVCGYAQRYADYKHKEDIVSGDFLDPDYRANME